MDQVTSSGGLSLSSIIERVPMLLQEKKKRIDTHTQIATALLRQIQVGHSPITQRRRHGSPFTKRRRRIDTHTQIATALLRQIQVG